MTLEEQLRRDEGVRYEPYMDSRGFATIGAGARLPLTDAEVNVLLTLRLNSISLELCQKLSWLSQLDQIRYDALLNMAYNLGVPRLLGFKKMLTAMQAQDWKLAAREALASDWYHQVGPRATRLAKQIETGVMQ